MTFEEFLERAPRKDKTRLGNKDPLARACTLNEMGVRESEEGERVETHYETTGEVGSHGAHSEEKKEKKLFYFCLDADQL